MSIRTKLTVMFLSIALIPLFLISSITFDNYKKSLEANRISQLENLASFKADKIETYFIGLKTYFGLSQFAYVIRKNLPALARLSNDPSDPEFVAGKNMIDQVYTNLPLGFDITAIMLTDPQGRVVYSSDPEHYREEFLNNLPDPQQTAFSEGKNKIYISDIFFNERRNDKPVMLVTGPASDLSGNFIGVIAAEVDASKLYNLIQDVTGLGRTGETLIGKKTGDQVLFLNPLRHDPQAALKRRATIGDTKSIGIQRAVLGQRGSGLFTDYRGKRVVGAWHYIPSIGWGVVAKIDSDEAFVEIENMRKLIFSVLVIIIFLASIMAISISRSVAGPIGNLSQAAQAIGSGNLDYQLEINLKDEIGQLSGSLAKMARDLKVAFASRDIERQRLYAVLETLPVYVILLDKDYRVPFANKFFRERFGESCGKRCYEYLFKLGSPCENCETYKVIKTNAPHHWEWLGPDNRNYDIYDFPFLDADGSLMILEMGIDITAQKRAQESLREALQYSRSLLESSLDPLVTISAEGKITDVNEATIEATGISRAQIIGTDFSSYFTEPEKARVGYQRVFDKGFVTDYPLTIRRKDGKLMDVLYNATVYKNGEGKIQGVFAAARDVTERKRVEDELKRHREHLEELVKERTSELQTILDSVPAMVFYKDKDNHFVRANKAFEKAMGLPKEKLEGRSLFDLYSGELADAYWKDDLEVIRTGKAKLSFVEKMETPQGVRLLQTDKIPYFNAQGHVEGVIGFSIDVTERKRAEDALRQTEERMRFALESSHTGFWDLDLVDHTAVRSIEHDKIFGYSELLPSWTYEQFLGHVLPEDRDAVAAKFQYANEHKTDWSFECRILTVDKRVRWIFATGHHQLDRAGSVRRMAGIVQDITERKQAEEDLRETLKQNKYLADLLGSSNQPFAVGFPDGSLGYMNHAFERLTGYNGEELKSMDWTSTLTPEEWREFERSQLDQLIETGQPVRYEKEYVRKDGMRVPIELLVHVAKDGKGRVDYFYTFLTDLTERKQAEKELKTALDRFYFVLSNMTFGVLLVSEDSGLEFVNQTFCDIFDLKESPGQLNNLAPAEMIAKIRPAYSDPDEAVARINELVGRGEPVKDEEVHMRGGRTYLRDFIPLRIGEHKLGRLWIHRDITLRKQFEVMLKRSNESLEQFAYVASHDLQEPLRVMSSYSQLLEKRYKDKLDRDAKDFIEFIVDAASRMQKLITDLLAYSRAARKDDSTGPVDCNEVMRKVTAALSASIQNSKAKVTYDELPTLIAPEVSFTQLFQNLVGNALKFHSSRPPVINISARREGGDWVFSVQDNGIGIEPQYKEKIFQIFQRLHSKQDYPGTGIGLSICKKIVENWGGKIWVESEPEKGSIFYFTIPTERG